MRRRLAGGAVAAAAATILGVAWMLEPASAGMGTHTQLGLPPCGWVLSIGTPCPTCGMTTAFSLAAHGRVGGAVFAQPAGAFLAFVTAGAFLVGTHMALTGSSTHLLLARLWRGWMGWAMLVLVLGAWAWKIAISRGVLS